MFQKDIYKFSKREGMYKIFFNDFQMFQKEYFSTNFSQCLFKNYVQRFSKYIFLCTFKWFFFCTKNLKDLKNMYKCQS